MRDPRTIQPTSPYRERIYRDELGAINGFSSRIHRNLRQVFHAENDSRAVRGQRSVREGNFQGAGPVGIPVVDGGDYLGGGIGGQVEIERNRETGFDHGSVLGGRELGGFAVCLPVEGGAIFAVGLDS